MVLLKWSNFPNYRDILEDTHLQTCRGAESISMLRAVMLLFQSPYISYRT